MCNPLFKFKNVNISTVNKANYTTIGGNGIIELFNFIQQKSPTSISGEMNVKLLSFWWGFKMNKVKASGGDMRF